MMHYRKPGHRFTVCGSNTIMVPWTTNPELVECPECRDTIDDEENPS